MVWLQYFFMNFIVRASFAASALTIYETWLNSEGHSEMTGGDASCTDFVNGDFEVWDGYITGKNLELIPGELIKQTWRTSDFDEGQPDSIIEISFNEISSRKTQVTIKHSQLLDKDTGYKKSWRDHYFLPMEDYFEEE
jgi:activator of HSP90 ATPase